MTDRMTSMDVEISSWETLYILTFHPGTPCIYIDLSSWDTLYRTNNT